MVNMAFKEDLLKAREIEVNFACLLLKHGACNVELAPDRKFSDWDVKAKQWELENYYEIKDDIISSTTGNVWFEFMCNWSMSWVYVSKADFIVYHVDDKFYCIQRPMLLARLNFVKKERKKWWDWDKSDLFIVKKEDFFTFVDKNWWIWQENYY